MLYFHADEKKPATLQKSLYNQILDYVFSSIVNCSVLTFILFLSDISVRPKRVAQDPNVQKHASQILQKMLQQGEADLQVMPM